MSRRQGRGFCPGCSVEARDQSRPAALAGWDSAQGRAGQVSRRERWRRARQGSHNLAPLTATSWNVGRTSNVSREARTQSLL